MKKQIHLVVIVLFLLIANLVLAFQFRNTSKENRRKFRQLSLLFEKVTSDNELTNIAWATSANLSSNFLPRDFTEQIPQNGALVVRISDKHCSSCIDQLLFEIRKHLDDIGSKNVVVMYSAKKTNHIDQAFRKRLMNQKNFIRIPENIELTPLDKFNIPYLFYLDKTGQVQASFLPYPATEKFTGIFLNHISIQLHKSHEN